MSLAERADAFVRLPALLPLMQAKLVLKLTDDQLARWRAMIR